MSSARLGANDWSATGGNKVRGGIVIDTSMRNFCILLVLVLCGRSQTALAQPTTILWPDRFGAESISPVAGAQAKMMPCERSKYAVVAGQRLVVGTDSLDAYITNELLSDAETAGGSVRVTGDTLIYDAKAGADGLRDEIRIRSCVDAIGVTCTERTITVLVGRRGTNQRLTVEAEGGEVVEQMIEVPQGPLSCGSINAVNTYEYARYRELRFSDFQPGNTLRYRAARASGDDVSEVIVCNVFGTCDTTVVTFRVLGPRATLPFFDDFSYRGPRPDPRLWQEDAVYVNDAYGVRAPSYGVATFDGVDGGGRDYGEGIQDIDQLTTAPMDLTGVAAANRVFVKYYLQTGGRGLAPEEEDRFITQFKRRDGAWVNQRSVSGSAISKSDTVFKYHALPVEGEDFRHRDFQVRFLMRANAAGSNDSWQLDYVRVEQAQDTSRVFRDIALAARPPSPLQPYSLVPYTQFRERPELLRERLPVELWNHFGESNNVSRSRVVAEDSFGIELLSAGLLTGAQFNLPTGFSRINNPIPADPLGSYKQAASGISAEQARRLTLSYQLGIDQDQSRLEAVRRNDTASTTIRIKDEYAYDDGTAEIGLVAGGIGEQIVVRYTAFVADSLRGLRFAFPNLSPADAGQQLINLRVFVGDDFLKERKSVPTYEQTFVRPYFLSTVGDTVQGLTSYQFLDADALPVAVAIPPGNFYVGWQQGSDVSRPVQVGVDLNNDNVGAIFTEFGTGWKALPSVLKRFSGSLMVRPAFGPIRNSSAVREAGVHRFAVYPNPTYGRINLRLDDAHVTPARYEVFDAVGRVVTRGAFDTQLDLALGAGVYVLRLLDRDGTVYGRERLIVQ